jgi:hypothetical protein
MKRITAALAALLAVSASAASIPSYELRLTAKGVRATSPAQPAPEATPTPAPPAPTPEPPKEPEAPAEPVAQASMLLRFDSLPFVDSSATPRAVRVVGSVGHAGVTAAGAGALGLGSTSSGLVVAGSQDFAFPSGTDFTVEAFVYSTSMTQYKQIIGQWGSTNSYQLALNGGALGWVTPAGQWAPQAPTPLSLNTWHHVAVARAGMVTKLFVDGAVVGTASDNLNYTFNNATGMGIGRVAEQNGYGFYGGAIDEVRVTKGVARYTGPFTPPALPR